MRDTNDAMLPSPYEFDVETHKERLIKHAKVANQYIVAIIACLITLLSTVVFAYMSAVWPRLIEKKFATVDQINFLSSLTPACAIIGPLTNSNFINRIGRKYTICLCYIPYIIMSILLWLGNSYETFFVACCFGMFNWLFSYSIASVYISEVSGPHLRPFLCALISFSMSLATIPGYIMASMFDVKQAGLIFLTYSLLALMLSLRNLDSPYYLLKHSNVEQVKQNLKVLYQDEAVEKELIRLQDAVRDQSTQKSTGQGRSINIFKQKRHLVAFLLNLNLLFAISFSGGDPVFLARPTLLRKGCYSLISIETAEIISSIPATLTQIVLAVLMRFIRRRKLYIFSISSACIALLTLALYYLQKVSNPWLENICDFLPLGLLMWLTVSIELGITPMSYIYLRELIPTEYVCIYTFLLDVVQPVLAALSIAIFGYFIHSISYCSGFMFLFVCTFSSMVIFLLFVPETQGKFLEEVEQQFELKIVET